MSVEQVVVSLTAQQIEDLITEKVLRLVILLFLTGIGAGVGIKAKNEVKKFIGIIVASLSAIGSASYTLQIIQLTQKLTQLK